MMPMLMRMQVYGHWARIHVSLPVECVDQRDYLRGVHMIILYSPLFLAYSALPAAQFNQRASLNYSLWVGNEMTQLIVLPSSTLLADFVLGLWPPNPE